MNISPPADHVPLPVVYRAEARPVGRRHLWWPGVPERCPSCRPAGWLYADEDRVACASCGRATHEIRQKRPAPIPRDLFEGRGWRPPPPRPGRPCAYAGCTDDAQAQRTLCSRHRIELWRAKKAAAEPSGRCERCSEPTYAGYSARFCRAHYSRHRWEQQRARKEAAS